MRTGEAWAQGRGVMRRDLATAVCMHALLVYREERAIRDKMRQSTPTPKPPHTNATTHTHTHHMQPQVCQLGHQPPAPSCASASACCCSCSPSRPCRRLGLQQHVLGLDVPVDHGGAGAVQERQRRRHVQQPRQRLYASKSQAHAAVPTSCIACYRCVCVSRKPTC